MHAKHSVNLDNKIFLVFMKMTQMTSLFNQNEIFFVFFEFVNLLHGRCICMSLSRMYIEYYQFIIMFYGCHRRWCNKVMILNELLRFKKKIYWFFSDFFKMMVQFSAATNDGWIFYIYCEWFFSRIWMEKIKNNLS